MGTWVPKRSLFLGLEVRDSWKFHNIQCFKRIYLPYPSHLRSQKSKWHAFYYGKLFFWHCIQCHKIFLGLLMVASVKGAKGARYDRLTTRTLIFCLAWGNLREFLVDFFIFGSSATFDQRSMTTSPLTSLGTWSASMSARPTKGSHPS